MVPESGDFIPVEDCGISFSRDRRVQGAIELSVDGLMLLGRDESDTIDALWSLLVTYVEQFMAGEGGVLNFPERRLVFSLEKASRGNVLVKFTDQEEKRTALIREEKLLQALTSGAVEFFSAVLASAPKDEWSYRRDLATAVRLREECSTAG